MRTLKILYFVLLGGALLTLLCRVILERFECLGGHIISAREDINELELEVYKLKREVNEPASQV